MNFFSDTVNNLTPIMSLLFKSTFLKLSGVKNKMREGYHNQHFFTSLEFKNFSSIIISKMNNVVLLSATNKLLI